MLKYCNQMDRKNYVIVISDAGNSESDNVIVISSDDKEDDDNDDDVYFVPRRKRMISDGDDLPRIRRERRNRKRHPRPWSKVKLEPIEHPHSAKDEKEKESSFDDEPPRIPPLPDLSDVLPDLTQDQDPSSQKHGRKTQTSKENCSKEENKKSRCQPVSKRKSKSVDFYKTQSNAILGELFSVSDGDKFMIPSWHKIDGQTNAINAKHKTGYRQRNSSGCSARSRNSSGNSVASNEHFETPSKRRTSDSRLEDNAFVSSKVVHDTDRSGDEQQRKRFKKETKVHNHHKHLSHTKSLKSSNHKKSIHLHHTKKLQGSRSSSVDIPVKKPSHQHLPKRSISVGSQPVKDKAGVFEVLESMSQSPSETDSDIGSTTESIKLQNDVWSHSFHEKQKIWNNCSVRLNKLLIKFKGDGIVGTEKVSKAERHFLDVTDKNENILKPCDTDSLTVDLLSVSESNDEDVEQKSLLDHILITDTESLPDISDHKDVVVVNSDNDSSVQQDATAKNIHSTIRKSIDETDEKQEEQTCTDVKKAEKNDSRLNYSLKSNEFSDVSDDERSKKLDYSLKDDLLSDISNSDNEKLDYSLMDLSDISDAENTKLDYSFKSEYFSDVSDTEETVSHCDTVSHVTAKDAEEVKDKSVTHACDPPVISNENSKDLLKEKADIDVDNTADTDFGDAHKLSPNRNRSSVIDSSMPILERMSLEFSETARTLVEDLPVLDREDSESSSDDAEDVKIVGTMSAPASFCDFNIFSKLLYPKSTCTSTASLKSSSSYPPKPSPLHSSYSVDVLENADSIDSLPSITPSKSRKRKVSCTPTKHVTSQQSVYRRFLPSCSESKPKTRLGVQEQTTQLSALLKDYLLVSEHNPGISDMPDANKNMVAGCEEDNQIYYLSHAIKLLNHFSKKYYLPNDLILQVIGSTFYGEDCKENHVHSLSQLVKTVDNTYPGHFCVKWEEVSKCLDVLTSVDRKIEAETTQASSHLRLLVQCLKNDLYCKDLGDSREIHRTCAYRMLSYDVGSSGRRREVVSYLKRELHVGDTDRARNVIKELQELLQLGVDCSSSCVDCANTLAGDLMSTYVYLPHVGDKHALLAGTCSPLLRYKLLELVLENQYSGTLPLGGFPDSLRAVIQCFFRATPLINPLTPPISPVEELGAGAREAEEERLTVYTPEDAEELAMLLYHVVDSYLISTQEKSYMALRRRSQYSDRDLRDGDRAELARLPEHVAYLERHLRRLTPELTHATDHYLLLLTCLADLS